MNIYFGFGIIGFVLVVMLIKQFIEYRDFYYSFRDRNPDHVQFLQRGGR